MKESDDEIDDIFNDGRNYYYQGLAAGQEQASTYSMAEIEAEGFAFGQEVIFSTMASMVRKSHTMNNS